MSPEMLRALISAVPAALIACVAPGWFWAGLLAGSRADLAERLAFSTALSMTLVPAVALVGLSVAGTGVTLTIAVISVLVVFVAGLALRLRLGAERDGGDAPSSPPRLNAFALAMISAALTLSLWSGLYAPETGRYLLPTALLVGLAGVAALFGSRAVEPSGTARQDTPGAWGVARWLLLGGVLVGVLVRGYWGPVAHDWPYLRGGDQFNHGVQANEMLSVGHYDAFLVYPPGFSTLTACVSRLSGLGPLELYPVLAPALILLPALACYALAKRLWGPWCGVAAALFAGLLMGGTWANIEQARYPNLVSAQFLLPLAVAALVGLYRSPSPRAVALFALMGSSVVLYHSVGSYYAAILFALVGLLVLPYLLLRDRRRGLALFLSLAGLGTLAVAFAWDTYDLGGLIAGLLTGSETGAGGEAVSIVIGTQPIFDLAGLPARVSPTVFWLGLLGAALLLVPGPKDAPGLPARATLLFWAAILFVGSRTALSGFPQRFERDLGIPLSVLAASALLAVLAPIAARRPEGRRRGILAAGTLAVAAVAAAISLTAVGVGAWRGLETAAVPATGTFMTPELEEAGRWLERRNDGGKIVTSPSFEAVPSRGMLALGSYDGLQSYPARRVETPRSLPPGGAREIKDAQRLLQEPAGDDARRIIRRHGIRYVVLSKATPGADPRAFEDAPRLYRKAFENGAAVVFEAR